MKKISSTMAGIFLSLMILTVGGRAFCANDTNASQAPKNPNQALSPKQPNTKTQEKWRKALEGAQREFQNTNDRESAEFVGKMLDAVNKPGGPAPAALTAMGKRMETMTRDLVRKGALESAAEFNWTLWQVLYVPGPGADAQNRSTHPNGGVPGPDGLVLYMSFDAAPKDGVVRDESGAGNHGRVEGAQWVSEGRFGGAYQFHLANLTDRIIVPDSNSLNPGKVTIAAWFKTTDSDGFFNRIIDKDYRKGYCLSVCGDYYGKGDRGKLVFETNDQGNTTNNRVSDGQWHHTVSTYDGQTMRLYLDGVEKNQKRVGRPGPVAGNHWDLCIGNSVVDYGTGEFLAFDGLIDEVRIYNRVLSAEEIKALTTSQAGGSSPAGTATKASPADRLKQVKELYDQGLISKEAYEQKQKEILNSL